MITEETDQTKSVEEIKAESRSYPLKAKDLALAINDDRSMMDAGKFLMTIKGFRKKAEEFFKPMKKKARDLLNEIIDREKEVDAPLSEAERTIKGAMSFYQEDQDRLSRLESERLANEARKQAEEAQLALAEEVAKNGDQERANAVLDTPVTVPVISALKAAKIEGVSYREAWKCQVYDVPALVRAAASGQVPISVLEPNQVALNSMARSLKGEMKYPGVRVWCEKEVAARAK